MYRIKLAISEEEKKDYQKRKRWPLPINDHLFDETTVIETSDLMPFVGNKKHPYSGGKLRLDPRLSIEVINEDSETTD